MESAVAQLRRCLRPCPQSSTFVVQMACVIKGLRMTCRVLPAAVSALALLLASPALGATHALLAGVTRYDHLPEDKHLKAPANDVDRMRAALLGWGVEPGAMTVLGEGIAGARGRATHANLLRELEALPARVAAGDWVVIYLSGHGAISRDVTGTQRSGLNSVFLPADVLWPAPGSDDAPRNALFDTVIGAALDRVRATGAHVWFINDSCHSGDSVRSAMAEAVREKSVGATPVARGRPVARPLAQRRNTEALPGRLVAFYAAQVSETAREFSGDGEGWTSAFTLALTHAMARPGARDARTLIAHAVQGVRALRPRGIFQTPYADEDLAEGQALLAGKGEEVLNRFSGAGEGLDAGILDGFDTGAELALFDSATATTPLGRARVVRGGLARSRIAPLDGASLPATGWFARLAEPAREGRLTIGAAVAEGAAPALLAHAQTALAKALAEPLQAVAPAGVVEADVAVHVLADRLQLTSRRALLGIAQSIDIPFSTSVDDGLARRLSAALHRLDLLRRMERAETLAAAVPAAQRMPVTASLRRFAGRAATPCPAPAATARAEMLGPALPLATCDVIEVELRNTSAAPRFVQVLAVHPDGRMQAVAPRCGESRVLKLEAGQATAGRASAGAKSALPVVWFTLPKTRTGDGPQARMALQVLSLPLDGAAIAPDPCQFERFNGAAPIATRGTVLFDEASRSAGTRPGEITLLRHVLEWTAR